MESTEHTRAGLRTNNGDKNSFRTGALRSDADILKAPWFGCQFFPFALLLT